MKTDWTKMIDKEEKEIVIERYEKVINILKDAIWNEEALAHFKFVLEYLEPYLIYIPNGPFFNDVIPTEIKEKILSLSYSCDSEAFIGASVCQEWKGILENRLIGKKVIVEDEDILKAAVAHKLDVHLVIRQDVTEIDKELVTAALTSVSKFTVRNDYSGYNDDLEFDDEVSILSIPQFEHLFESISKGDKIMDEVKLAHLNLQDLNQERLANFFVSKIQRLTLKDVALDVETFIAKFQQDSVSLKLTHLTLRDLDFVQFPDNTENVSLGTNVADALCKVENVNLCGWTFVFIKSQLMGRLMENILHKPVTMKTLIVNVVNIENLRFYCPDFESLINAQDLKIVFSKMATLQLEGFFTLEQLEAIRSLSDVEVNRVQIKNSEEFFHSVKKGSRGIF